MNRRRNPEKRPASAGERAGAGQAENGRGGTGKAGRVRNEARGLLEDFTSWIELRLRLAQLDLESYVRRKIDEAALKAAFVAASLVAGLFALVTLALFAGWALGHPAWGFLATTGLLLLLTGVLHRRGRRMRGRKPEDAGRARRSDEASRNPSGAGKRFSSEEAGE